MNKNALVAQVAANAHISKSDAAKAVDAVLDSFADSLKGGQEVRLIGFGTFSVAHRRASQGRNPRTGESLTLDPRRTVTFNPASGLRTRLTAALCSDADRSLP